MKQFQSRQLCVSTAEEERNYFTGQKLPTVRPDPNEILPAGTYRVVDGRLYRVFNGVAPSDIAKTQAKPL